jgi:predicted regulator of Ras-like GTPase activity (Roadblock/LC7/MglB family)
LPAARRITGDADAGREFRQMNSLTQVIKNQVAKFPEVLAVVLSDSSGALLDASGDVDGETAAAITAVAARALSTVGEQLGVGALKRTSIVGPGLALVLVTNDQEVAGIYVDSSKPLAAFEKRLDGLLHR